MIAIGIADLRIESVSGFPVIGHAIAVRIPQFVDERICTGGKFIAVTDAVTIRIVTTVECREIVKTVLCLPAVRHGVPVAVHKIQRIQWVAIHSVIRKVTVSVLVERIGSQLEFLQWR